MPINFNEVFSNFVLGKICVRKQFLKGLYLVGFGAPARIPPLYTPCGNSTEFGHFFKGIPEFLANLFDNLSCFGVYIRHIWPQTYL